jgi:anti-sigma regulatory factor (Ser/Thr protein kinase)
VRDEGEGFDSLVVPHPTEATRLLPLAGVGLHLLRALVDEVSFEENGSVGSNAKANESLKLRCSMGIRRMLSR